MVIIKQFPKLWAFGKDTDASDGEYGLPPGYNIRLWRKAMACFHCGKRNCKQKQNQNKYLRKTRACFVSFLFKIRFFHCGKKWHGACEKFFNKTFNPKGE